MTDEEAKMKQEAAWFDARSSLAAELRKLQRVHNFTPLELINISLQVVSQLVVSALKDEESE